MTRETITKIFVVLFFVMLLMIPFGMQKYDEMVNSDFFETMEEVQERYGFFLEDVTDQLGINFVHQRPVVDEKLHHILPQIASVGASVSVADVNRNGFPDIYFTNSEFDAKNALYINHGDGRFEESAEAFGIADMNRPEVGASMGAVWGDFNNSGYEDLFIYRWGRPELYRNENGEGFVNVTEGAGFPDYINANTAFWFDYNNNGYLDLFIGGYYHEDVNLFSLTDTRMMPDSYEYATNGGLNYLFENQGDGTFRDISEQAGLHETRRWTLAAAAADINDSGYMDIVLANDYGVDEIFLNEQGERFRNVGPEAGIGFVPKSGMSVAFGDIMNQGQFSIYVTNISEAGVLMQGNNLWVPSRRSSGDIPRYRNVAGNMGVEIGEWGYGGQFIDLNNNGNLDLYVANGYVSAEPDTDYWYDYSRVVGGHRNIIIDANNWPAMNNRTFSGYQTNKIWLNDGAGRFREVARAVNGALDLDSRSIAYADLFGTGAMDLIVANQHQPAKIYRNHVREDHNWVGFNLEGEKSNKSAIGAVVLLHWDNKVTRKMVTGGDAFSSQSQRAVHFGIGMVDQVDRVEVRWPSGEVQVIDNPELNRYHNVREEITEPITQSP
ncbi:MAG: CRTAC1 family protein [Balneolaceae bacterium]|nr:CRTAC1 family protein [Balneolaceae bacterium]MCH8548622.1 CRTAC1 family protein [Balneolaceae bacterium]